MLDVDISASIARLVAVVRDARHGMSSEEPRKIIFGGDSTLEKLLKRARKMEDHPRGVGLFRSIPSPPPEGLGMLAVNSKPE